MFLSIDSRAYLLSKLNKYNFSSNKLSKFKKDFLGEGSGPQDFLSSLAREINKSNEISITYNIFRSDLHLLNLGFYSPIWKYLKIKDPNRIIIRFDGIGIDNCKNKKRTKDALNSILKRGKFVIFQSEFCKEFFKNEFGYLPNNSVIHNGSNPLIKSKNKEIKKIKDKISIPQKEDYFVVAGRFTERKRIEETINSFIKLDKFNLVVLSDLPDQKKVFHDKIRYLGLQKPSLAKRIICNSKALIHMDRYDWCPNIVINALVNNVPVICSNYGGTSEIVKNNGIIVNEFSKNIPFNLMGLEIVKKSIFPDELFHKALFEINKKIISTDLSKKYSIKNCSKNYIKSIKSYYKNLNII
tara:strand:+ start:10627 stop:11691 length:1065 start_codon:yes stop_codon:yes gene_type:complete